MLRFVKYCHLQQHQLRPTLYIDSNQYYNLIQLYSLPSRLATPIGRRTLATGSYAVSHLTKQTQVLTARNAQRDLDWERQGVLDEEISAMSPTRHGRRYSHGSSHSRTSHHSQVSPWRDSGGRDRGKRSSSNSYPYPSQEEWMDRKSIGENGRGRSAGLQWDSYRPSPSYTAPLYAGTHWDSRKESSRPKSREGSGWRARQERDDGNKQLERDDTEKYKGTDDVETEKYKEREDRGRHRERDDRERYQSRERNERGGEEEIIFRPRRERENGSWESGRNIAGRGESKRGYHHHDSRQGNRGWDENRYNRRNDNTNRPNGGVPIPPDSGEWYPHSIQCTPTSIGMHSSSQHSFYSSAPNNVSHHSLPPRPAFPMPPPLPKPFPLPQNAHYMAEGPRNPSPPVHWYSTYRPPPLPPPPLLSSHPFTSYNQLPGGVDQYRPGIGRWSSGISVNASRAIRSCHTDTRGSGYSDREKNYTNTDHDFYDEGYKHGHLDRGFHGSQEYKDRDLREYEWTDKGQLDDHRIQSGEEPRIIDDYNRNSRAGKKAHIRQPTINRTHPSDRSLQPHTFQPDSNERRRKDHQPSDPFLPVPHPTEEYLQISSVPPVSVADFQPILIILDLNGALLYRNKNSRGGAHGASIRPNLRPNLRGFLEYLFSRFYVMVWSSAQPQNVKYMVEAAFLKEEREKLVAVWARDTLGLSKRQMFAKVVVYKNLERVWEAEELVPKQSLMKQDVREKQIHEDIAASAEIEESPPLAPWQEKIVWSQANTILIDDSAVKATSQPYNHIEITEYANPHLQNDDTALLEVTGYLEELRVGRWGDVSAYMRSKPFKQGEGHWLDVGRQIVNQMSIAERSETGLGVTTAACKDKRREVGEGVAGDGESESKVERRKRRKMGRKLKRQQDIGMERMDVQAAVGASDDLGDMEDEEEAEIPSNSAKPEDIQDDEDNGGIQIVEEVPSKNVSVDGKEGDGNATQTQQAISATTTIAAMTTTTTSAIAALDRSAIEEDVLDWSSDESLCGGEGR